ncbi:MAG: hypothetical protein ACI8P3_000257 [Saprospiraceae bacterium]|jgi:hypothetical protein
MKNIFFLALAVILLSSCSKNDQDVRFEMVYEREFTIPAGLNVFDTHYFPIRDISIGSYLTANNVTAADLIAINPGSARLSTKFTGLAEYDFIRDVSIVIFTDDENNNKEVFWRPSVPLNQGEDLDIFATLVDAKQYFEGTKFNLYVKLNLQAVPQQTVETRFTFSFLAK